MFGTGGRVRLAAADSEVVRRLRAAGAVIVGKTNTCELGQWPFTSGPAFGHTRNPWSRNHTPAARRAVARRRWRPVWSPRRSVPTAQAVSGFRRRGPIWSGSSRSGGASPRGRCPRRSTASPSTACWPAPSSTRRWCSTPHRATSTVICTSRRRSQLSEYVGRAPGPLRIALSTKFPFNVFRPKLHPEIRDALHTAGEQLTDLGHTIVDGRPALQQADVVELPGPVHVGPAGLGGPPRPRRRPGPAHRRQPSDGSAAVGERAAQGPRQGSPDAAARGIHLQYRRRDSCADDRASAPAGARLRQTRRPVHRSRDDPRLSA